MVEREGQKSKDSQVVKMKLKREAEVASELKRLDHADELISLRVGAKGFEYLHLRLPLNVKSAFVADDLQRHPLPCLVVQGLVHVAKGSLAELGLDLVAEGDVVALRREVARLFIIVSLILHSPREESFRWNKEDLRWKWGVRGGAW